MHLLSLVARLGQLPWRERVAAFTALAIAGAVPAVTVLVELGALPPESWIARAEALPLVSILGATATVLAVLFLLEASAAARVAQLRQRLLSLLRPPSLPSVSPSPSASARQPEEQP